MVLIVCVAVFVEIPIRDVLVAVDAPEACPAAMQVPLAPVERTVSSPLNDVPKDAPVALTADATTWSAVVFVVPQWICHVMVACPVPPLTANRFTPYVDPTAAAATGIW